MRRRSLFSAAFSAVASLSIAASALAFSGVTNGSFENGTFSGAPWDTLNSGSTNITGWTIGSGSVDSIGSYWPASNGSRSIDLSGDGPGTISQALATTIGNTYTVSFDLSGNPACGPAIKTLIVNATGGSADPFTYDISVAGNTLTDMKWASRTYSFVATVTTSTLTLTSTTEGICGPAIDNIVVTETAAPPPPDVEPGTEADCKDDGWIALVDGAGNHFKNQGDCVSYVATDHRNVAATTRRAGAFTRLEVKAANTARASQSQGSAPVPHAKVTTGKPAPNVSKPVDEKVKPGLVNAPARAGHRR